MDDAVDLTLRVALEDDMPAVAAVLRAAFGEHMIKRLQHGRTVVALVGGEIVGCVAYEPEDEHVYLGRVAVLPPHRQHGIGAALVRHVEESARRLGTPRVRLAVSAVEAHLREWYERAGYAAVEESFFPGSDEPTYIIFEKDVC